MRLRLANILLLLSLSSVCAYAQPGTNDAPVSAGEYLLRKQQEFMTPAVVYCAEKMPQIGDALLEGNQRFRGIAAEATRPLRSRLKGVLSQPVPEGLTSFDPGNDFLEQGKKQSATEFCSKLLSTLQTVSVESLRQAVEESFAAIEQRASQKAAERR